MSEPYAEAELVALEDLAEVLLVALRTADARTVLDGLDEIAPGRPRAAALRRRLGAPRGAGDRPPSGAI